MHDPVRIGLGAPAHMPGQPGFRLHILGGPHPGAFGPAPDLGDQFIHLDMYHHQVLEKLLVQAFTVLPIAFQPACNGGRTAHALHRQVRRQRHSFFGGLEPVQRRSQPGGVFLPTRPTLPSICRLARIPLPVPPQCVEVRIRILVEPAPSIHACLPAAVMHFWSPPLALLLQPAISPKAAAGSHFRFG
jgi:hypothetical protein